MKSRKSYFVIIIVSLIVIVLNVTLIYLDEHHETSIRELSDTKSNILSFGKEIRDNISDAEYIYVQGRYGEESQSLNKLKEKFQWHMGYLPRPSTVILYPYQTKSHENIAATLIESGKHMDKVKSALINYRSFLQWSITSLQNHATETIPLNELKQWPSSRYSAIQLIDSFVDLSYKEVKRQQEAISQKLRRLSKAMFAIILLSLLYFTTLTFYILNKLLNPYLASKGKLDMVGKQMPKAANIAFWEFDLKKQMYTGGREFAQFIGIEDDSVALTPKQMIDLVEPEDRDMFVEQIESSLVAKVPKAIYEARFKDIKGRKRHMTTLAEYLYSPDGKLLKRHGIIQDTTTLKKIEKELQLSHGRLEEVLYQLEIGVAEVSPVWHENAMMDIRFNNVNEAFCRIFQQPSTEIKGKNYSEVFQFFGNSWIRLMSRSLKENITTSTTELYNTTINKWLKLKVYRESEFRIIAFVEDITQERNIRQSLKKSQERMVFSEQMARFGYCEIDLSNYKLTGNQVALEIHGLAKRKQLSLVDFMQVLVSDDREMIKSFASDLKTKKQVEGTYRVLVNKEVRYIHCKLETIETNTPEKRAFGFVHDVTEVKQGEQDLIKAKEKAEESDQLKNAFLANMSHEIRTPLSAILGFSSILAKNEVVDDEQRKECQKLIEKNSSSLMLLINDVIEMAKIESGETTIRPVSFDVNQFVEDSYNVFSAELLKKGRTSIRLFKQNSVEGEFRIIADQDRVNQVMNNLISNAIKFTPKGFIEFGYECDGDEIIFFVRDSGIGIDEDKQKAIFKMFRQANLKIAGEFGGTGLGLAICEKLVHLMNGRIWVDSKKGVGSTFFFSLPMLKEYTKVVVKQETTNANNESIPDFSDKVILVADDEEFIHVLFRNYLSETGVRVVSAYTGKKTVETLHSEENIDLVLLDMRMPEMNGEDTVIEIRKENKDIPVIAQTAYAFEGDKERFITAGCTDYLSKPIKEDELLSVLSKYLQS